MSEKGNQALAETEVATNSVTLAALQSQIADLKAELEELRQAPQEERLQQLEDALLSVADLFAALRLACFGSDRREDVGKVAAIAAAIRQQRKG